MPMIIRWDVKRRAEARGWTNAHQFAIGAGISYPIATRILKGDPVEKLEVATLGKLTRAFGLSSPWSLLKVEP